MITVWCYCTVIIPQTQSAEVDAAEKIFESNCETAIQLKISKWDKSSATKDRDVGILMDALNKALQFDAQDLAEHPDGVIVGHIEEFVEAIAAEKV